MVMIILDRAFSSEFFTNRVNSSYPSSRFAERTLRFSTQKARLITINLQKLSRATFCRDFPYIPFLFRMISFSTPPNTPIRFLPIILQLQNGLHYDSIVADRFENRIFHVICSHNGHIQRRIQASFLGIVLGAASML